MKKLRLITMIIFVMFMSVGCWDVQDIDELYLPTIISFDEDNEAHTYNINSTVMNFTSGKVVNEFPELNGKTISESIESIQKTISGDTSMSLLQTIVLGEEFTKNSTYSLVNWLYKEDINSNVSMCVYNGEAKEVIEMLKPKEEQSSNQGQASESQSQSKDSKKDSNDKITDTINLISEKKEEGYEVIQSLKEFAINNESNEKTAVLPTIEIKGENIEIVGTTVFKHFNNIGYIDSKDTKYLMLLRGIKSLGSTTFENINFKNNEANDKLNIFNKKNIDKAIKNQSVGENNKSNGVVQGSNKRKVKVHKSKDKYIFDIEIDLDCNILENNNGSVNLITNKENIESIEIAINKKLEDECNKFVAKIKNDIKYDVFDLTKYAKVKYSESIKALEDEKFFENSEINIKVNSKIKNTSLFN